MAIRLKIENVDRLPNGGLLDFSSSRSFRIGRENCEWTLPDPNRFISGVHCEVRAEDDGYWLHDVSRNGTFLNGTNTRIASPHKLAAGDRLRIGRYVVSVAVDENRPRHRDPVVGAPVSETGPVRLDSDPFFAIPRDAAPGIATAPNPKPAQGDAIQFPPLRAPGMPKDTPPSESPLPTKPAQSAEPAQILRDIAAGAGVSPDVFLQRDPQEVANEIGVFLRIAVDELASLLKARAAAKVLARSTHRTMINSTGNNPLKFVPGAEEMLEKMFARRGQGYLDGRHSLEEAFSDLKAHELATYTAMQSALAKLLDELSPEAIERRVVASAFGSKKARAWDAFIKVWESKEQGNENGMLDAFLEHFSEAYAKASKQK